MGRKGEWEEGGVGERAKGGFEVIERGSGVSVGVGAAGEGGVTACQEGGGRGEGEGVDDEWRDGS